MTLKRRSPQHSPCSAGGVLTACELSVLYPTVVEFLCKETWEDGASRLTGTITLMAEGGMVKAAVNDRDGQLSCFVSGKSVTSLLEALEVGLGDDSLDWRVKKPFGQGPRKGKG